MARVVVVDDLFARAGKQEAEGDDVPSTSTKADPAAIDLLSQVVEPNSLILVESSLSSVPAAVKKSGAGIEVRAGIAPRGTELERWVKDRAKEVGASIDQQAIRALLDAMFPGSWQRANSNPQYDSPPDLDALAQELSKLATFAHPGPIDKHAIATMTASGTADQLFPLVSAVYSGQLAAAISLLADAIDQGEDHFRLLAQLYGQAELVPPLEASRGTDPEQVGKALGLSNPKRMVPISRTRQQRPLSPRLASITAIDRALKQGELRTTDDVLFALIDTLSGR
jgi:DNA polymerase III delta subunit